MSLKAGQFEFGEFVLDTNEKVLLRKGKPLQATPKVLQLLHVLIEGRGHIVEKNDLMARLWPDSFVEESNLTFTVRQLRKLLGDDTRHPRFIETIPRRGYRFIDEMPISRSNGSKNGAVPARSSHLREAGASAVFSWKPLFFSAAGMLVLSLFLAAFFVLRDRASLLGRIWPPASSEKTYSDLTLETLTDTGNIISANISPDGKLLAYVSQDAGKRTVWLRQLATGKSVPILPASEDAMISISFSNDGEYVHYLHQPRDSSIRLSRMSILGGASTELAGPFHAGYGFSPDEKRIAFVRMDKTESVLAVADADGGSESTIVSYPRPLSIVGLAWSPDGKEIVYSINKFTSSGKEARLARIDVEGGAEQSVTDFRWNYLEGVMWLPDRSGFIACGRVEPAEPDQIWFISSDGKAEQVTQDSSQLSLMGATRDFSKILLSTTFLDSNVSVAASGDLTMARPVSKAMHDVSWTPDGQIVFPSRDTLKTDIWIASPDGSNKRQLTANDAVERSPVVTPDGKYVVFVSNQGGQQNIWRVDMDGNNPTQITRGDGETRPFLSRDGKLVYFNGLKDGTLWQVPIGGGEPELLISDRTFRAAISPGGGMIAFFGKEGDKGKLFVKSFPDLLPLHSFDASFNRAATPKIVWSADEGSLVYYRNDATETGNLWRQHLKGGEPQQLTKFTSNNIFDFSFSPDGSSLAVVRGIWNHDAVLLKGFR